MLRAYEGPPRVIVGFDGSDDATIALRYGVSEALARNASLVLLNAVDDTVLTSAWGVVFDPEQIRSRPACPGNGSPPRSNSATRPRRWPSTARRRR
jgi:nucleotide-binding universal stress UspA family protein